RIAERSDEAVTLNAAEYSQENAFEIAQRITSQSFPQSAIRNPKSFSVRLPDLIIVDGGKGQLSSACRELQCLGLHELPLIGLAKEFEEIYRPGRALPLLLPHDSGGLLLLQRIRN